MDRISRIFVIFIIFSLTPFIFLIFVKKSSLLSLHEFSNIRSVSTQTDCFGLLKNFQKNLSIIQNEIKLCNSSIKLIRKQLSDKKNRNEACYMKFISMKNKSLQNSSPPKNEKKRFLPCFEHCCFQFRRRKVKFEKFNENRDIYDHLNDDYVLIHSYGPFYNGYEYTNRVVKELASLNDYSHAGVKYRDCLYDEIEYLREKAEKFIHEKSYGRRNVSFNQIFRYDKMIINFDKGIVLYRLHGVLVEKHEPKIVVVEIEREKNYFKLVSERISYKTKINVAVCVKNVNKQFSLFLKHLTKSIEFDKVNFKGVIDLIVVDFGSASNTKEEVMKNEYKEHFTVIKYENVTFSKVICHSIALERVKDKGEIVLLLDVDIIIPKDFFYRVRAFTKFGKNIYNPVCFSLKKHGIMQNDAVGTLRRNVWHVLQYRGNVDYDVEGDVNDSNGFWRKFGTGIIAAYKNDFDVIGGFNTKLFSDKWGEEDNDVVVRFIKAGYNVFHAAEMNYFHTFHPLRSWRENNYASSLALNNENITK